MICFIVIFLMIIPIIAYLVDLIIKNRKIKAYLESVKVKDPYDILLKEYLDGNLKNRLKELNLKGIELFVELRVEECINIQAKYHEFYLEMEITRNNYVIGFDKAEVDLGDFQEKKLGTLEKTYEDLKNTLEHLENFD